jgi:tRNA(Ile)-lysidine synthase
VHPLAQRVLDSNRRQRLLAAGDRVGVAVSGGADSVALLRLLLELRSELGIVVSVVHLNHQLRGAESDADEQFVTELARQHDLALHRERADVAKLAGEKHLSVEAAAREARYGFFRRLIAMGQVDKIATGHTLDDQSETVLLRLVRGAGTKGLAGIQPVMAGSGPASRSRRQAPGVRLQGPAVVRPLLGTTRQELETYLAQIHQNWREDASNRDMRFARNRVRHGILPRLEEHLNPGVKRVLAEAAEIARAEEEYWGERISALQIEVLQRKNSEKRPAEAILLRDRLLREPLAVQRRLVRLAGEIVPDRQLEFAHVEEILAVARGEQGSAKSCNLPGNWRATRIGNAVRLHPASGGAFISYEHRLPIPGRVEIPEISSSLEATPLGRVRAEAGYNPEHLYAPQSLAKELVVRSWRPGDRFWPAHSKSPKKIKELLQKRKIALEARRGWPVIVSGDEIVWVRGFPAPRHLRPAKLDGAILIRELHLAQDAEER